MPGWNAPYVPSCEKGDFLAALLFLSREVTQIMSLIIEVVDDAVNRFQPSEAVHPTIIRLPEVYPSIDGCT